MTRRVSVATAKNELPSLIHEVEENPKTVIEITRHGVPVAILVAHRKRKKKDFVQWLNEWRASVTEWDDHVFENLREPSASREITLGDDDE